MYVYIFGKPKREQRKEIETDRTNIKQMANFKPTWVHTINISGITLQIKSRDL